MVQNAHEDHAKVFSKGCAKAFPRDSYIKHSPQSTLHKMALTKWGYHIPVLSRKKVLHAISLTAIPTVLLDLPTKLDFFKISFGCLLVRLGLAPQGANRLEQ